MTVQRWVCQITGMRTVSPSRTRMVGGIFAMNSFAESIDHFCTALKK